MMSAFGSCTPGIVPLGDPSEVDIGQRRAVEAQLCGADRRQIVGDHDGAEHRGHVENVALHGGDLLVAHRPVGGAEIHGALSELADAAARADRLVADLDARLPVVGVEPLGVNRVWKRRAGAGQAAGATGRPVRGTPGGLRLVAAAAREGEDA
jgi:hypothetical protein